MAMTKKEKERMEQLLTEAAFRRTAPVEPDVMPPASYKEIVRGWHFNSYNGHVGEGCTSSNYHSLWDTDKTTTQGAKKLFSSKMLALMAMRHEMEGIFARRLREVDQKIEAEELETSKQEHERVL